MRNCAASGSPGHSDLIDAGAAGLRTCEACAVLLQRAGSGVEARNRGGSVVWHSTSAMASGTADGPDQHGVSSKQSGGTGAVVLYPSPAGEPNRCSRWNHGTDIVSRNPILNEMEADVEESLVNCLGYSAETMRILPAADRRTLQAGRPDSHALEGLSGERMYGAYGRILTSLKGRSTEAAEGKAGKEMHPACSRRGSRTPHPALQVKGSEVVATQQRSTPAFKPRVCPM